MGQVIASIAAFFNSEASEPFGGAEAERFLRGGIVFVQRRAGACGASQAIWAAGELGACWAL